MYMYHNQIIDSCMGLQPSVCYRNFNPQYKNKNLRIFNLASPLSNALPYQMMKMGIAPTKIEVVWTFNRMI